MIQKVYPENRIYVYKSNEKLVYKVRNAVKSTYAAKLK